MPIKKRLKPALTTEQQEKQARRIEGQKKRRENEKLNPCPRKQAEKLYADEFGPKLSREDAKKLIRKCKELELALMELNGGV